MEGAGAFANDLIERFDAAELCSLASPCPDASKLGTYRTFELLN